MWRLIDLQGEVEMQSLLALHELLELQGWLEMFCIQDLILCIAASFFDTTIQSVLGGVSP